MSKAGKELKCTPKEFHSTKYSPNCNFAMNFHVCMKMYSDARVQRMRICTKRYVHVHLHVWMYCSLLASQNLVSKTTY